MMRVLFLLLLSLRVCFGQQNIITTYAGSAWIPPSGPLPALNAPIGAVYGVAADAAGNFYFTTVDDNQIYKVDPKGTLTVVGGTTAGYAGDGGPATAASFNGLRGITIDPAGNLFVADAQNYRIRKVTAAGIVTTVAGNGISGFSGDGGPAAAASISFADHVNSDASGNIYISDTTNHRMRVLRTNGVIETVAGNGLAGSSGDGGPAINASLNSPQGAFVDSAGNLYIADTGNNRIRRVTSGGIISTIAGTGTLGFSGDGGPATAAQLNQPRAITMTSDGTLYFADSRNYRVRKIDTTGSISTVAGSGIEAFSGDGGPAANAQLNLLLASALTADGRYLFNEIDNGRVRAFTPGGTVSTLAGNGNARYSGDGGPASNAVFYSPAGLARDPAGNLYVSDTFSNRVRRITPFGIANTFAGTNFYSVSGDGGLAAQAGLAYPSALALDSAGNLYIADSANNKVRRVAANGTISTFAGNGQTNGLGDGGQAANASLSLSAAIPSTLASKNGLAFDSGGNLYIADTAHHRIRKVTPAGAISTFAGNGTAGFAGDGGQATNARIDFPSGLAFDSTGNLYIVDTSNHRVRKVTAAGVISTFAGNGTAGYSGDGGAATAASLQFPGGIAVDSAGLVYIADTANNVVRRVASNGIIATIAGNGAAGFTGDGRPALGAELNTPIGLAIDSAGNLFIADSNNGRVRLIRNGAAPSLALSQTGFTLTALAGGGLTLPQSVTVLNGGAGSMPWTASASTTSGGAQWLGISPAQGTSTPTAPQSVSVSANPAGLAAGAYYGLIQVTSPGIANSPQFATVVLNVLGASSATGPAVQPTGLVFTGVPAGANPAAQKISVSVPGTATVSFTASIGYGQGSNWLTLQPATGSAAPGQPATIAVQPSLTGLAAGVYTATLTLAFSDGAAQRLDVLLVVSTGAPTGGVSQPRSTAAAGCAPTRLLPIFTVLGSTFTATAGWPIALQAKIFDDCGQPMTGGTVGASFSNNDPALPLSPLGDGRWDGTWSPRSAANVTIKLTAQTGALQGSTQISGQLSANPDPPLIASGGLLNAASYALQSPVAPGTMVSIFGSHLSQSPGSAESLPLASRMNGTFATVAGIPLPLLYTSDGQVNAVMPYGLAADATLQLIVQRGNSLSLPEPVRIAPSEPAIFTRDLTGAGQGIVLGVNADGSQYFAEPATPATAGAVLVIYAAGLGSVDPAVPAGSPAPLSPLSVTSSPVSVSIGGVNATVLFAGLVPGFTALYQVNAVVPAGVRTGDAVPIILGVSGQNSPSGVTIAVR